MNIRIAAFGSKSLIERVGQFIPQFQGVEWIPYIYEEIEEIPKLVLAAPEVDVLLFTGSLPYMVSKREIEKRRIPAIYIPLDEYIVSLTLFNVKYNLNINTFSLDISDSVNVREVFDEVSLDMNNIHIKNLNRVYADDGAFDYEEIIDFHEQLWKEGKTEIAVTCVSMVYKKLQARNVPVIRMIHPQKTIKDTLRRAIMQGELEQSKKAQIVVGFVRIEDYNKQLKEKGSYLVENNALLLHQLLLDFSADIHASIQRIGKDEFIVYGTKGAFELITNQYRELTILNKIEKLLEIKVNIGFGFGLTTKEAENNAQTALKYSADFDRENSAYIVSADKRLLGPLTDDSNNESSVLDSQRPYDYLLLLSKKSGINLQNVKKIVEFSRMISFQPFTASDLAEYMQVSRRGAERFIKVLANTEIAKAVGEEQVSQLGRPTTLYQIDFKELSSAQIAKEKVELEVLGNNKTKEIL